MEQNQNPIAQWLDTATAGIRFQPDRKAVKEELAAHLEDKTADFQRIFPDMTREEAEERALGEMGDAGEIGRELAHIHKPWLGYLWTASRVLVLLMAVSLMGLLGVRNNYFDFLGSHDRDYYWNSWYAGVQDHEWSPPPAQEVGIYRLEVTRAARWEEQALHGGEKEQVWSSAAMTLRVTAPWPWERVPEENPGLEEHMTAADSTGKRYSFQPGPLADIFDDRPIQSGDSGLCWRNYELYIENISPEAEWVRLEYDFGGQSFSFRVDIPERCTYFRNMEYQTQWEVMS